MNQGLVGAPQTEKEGSWGGCQVAEGGVPPYRRDREGLRGHRREVILDALALYPGITGSPLVYAVLHFAGLFNLFCRECHHPNSEPFSHLRWPMI